MKIIPYFIVCFVFLGISCTKQNDTENSQISKENQISAPFQEASPLKNLTEVVKFNKNNHIISVKTINGKLQTGYNDMYISVTDAKTGEILSPEKMKFLPMMRMYSRDNSLEISHSHSCPHSEELQKVHQKIFRGFAIFQMHSGKMGHWDLSFEYSIAGENFKIETKRIEIQPQSPENHLKFTRFKGKDKKTYILSFLSPTMHRSGRNQEVVAALFVAQSATQFVKAQGIKLFLDPRMPGADMQNHSTPFENFTQQPNGFYTATINYSMSGNWVLNFQLQNADNEIIAGTSVPKIPKTAQDFEAMSEVHLPIVIREGN